MRMNVFLPAIHSCGVQLIVAACALLISIQSSGAAQPKANQPVLLYTDIASGPNNGGENDQGIYLSLFGKNFGHGPPGSNVKVFIGGAEAGSYRSLGSSRGRPDIQQLTVQIGSLGKPKPGVPLAVKVVVNGVSSNDDITFTVNPGRILFVDNVKGNDLTAVAGDIAHPFRHVQTARLNEGAWGEVRPGDFIVMRGTGTSWTDLGYENFFLRARNKSGTEPNGKAGSGPITLMGYPGEDVFIQKSYDAAREKSGAIGAISAINGMNYPGMGQWMTVSNLRVEGGGHDGAINVEIHGNHWRVVNNELTAASAVNNMNAKAGGIVGNGTGEVWLGNHIHDVYCGPAGGGPLQNHGIYIDGEGEYEIAYNVIENIPGGSGFLTYANGSNGSNNTGNINFHHNLIRGVGKHGIALADGTREGVRIFNNIVADTHYSGLHFNTVNLKGARIYNNTFYNTNTAHKWSYGAVTNDWNLSADAIDMQNNIFVPSPGTQYAGGSVGFGRKVGIINRNLWYGGKGETEFDAYPQTGELKFVMEGKDFHLRPESWAIDAGSPAVARIVTNDYDAVTPRPQGLGFDIGAYELPR